MRPRALGALRPEPGLQVGSEEGREHNVEVKVLPGLRTGLVVVEA